MTQYRQASLADMRTPALSIDASDTSPATSRLPLWVWVATGVCIFWAGTTANASLTIFAVAVLPVMAQLLWRQGEPPLLAFACGMQWLQAAGVIFYLNFYRTTLLDASGMPELETATWMSLIGVLVLAVGMRIGLTRTGNSQQRLLERDALAVNINKLFSCYVGSFLLGGVASAVGFKVPALSQFVLTLGTIKWVFFFMVGYTAITQRRGYGFLAICVGVEFAFGLLGFFSTFKDVLFLLLVVFLTPSRALHGVRLVRIASVAAILLALGILWSAVKAEYREFLNQGSGKQEVLVSVEERFTELGSLLANFSWDQAAEGLDTMLVRVSYVQYFALTLGNVPATMPFENGALWLGALKQPLTPRIIFPDKPAIDDSERTSLYTGIETSGVEQGTSIGIGYIAESYIDFGRTGMYMPIVFLGICFTFIYRFFVTRVKDKLLGAGVASAILTFQANNIETSNIKIIGGTVVSLLVMSLFYFLAGRPLMQWLRDTPS